MSSDETNVFILFSYSFSSKCNKKIVHKKRLQTQLQYGNCSRQHQTVLVKLLGFVIVEMSVHFSQSILLC